MQNVKYRLPAGGIVRLISAITLLLAACFSAQATPVDNGSFVADRSCPLYQSKNKQTNPGAHYSTPGQTFVVKEILGEPNPHWLRVVTNAPTSPLRWIAAECGHVSAPNLAMAPSGNQCGLQQSFDSQILALSWQSAFCELRGANKPECQALTRSSYAAGHFTLHGLWPNKSSCSRGYGYCGKVKQKPGNFCDYPPLQLSDETASALKQLMPSYAAGSCLERHEWWKHGRCRDTRPDSYYQLAMALTQQVNAATPLMAFIQKNLGHTVQKQDFLHAWQQAFGADSIHKLTLKCDKQLLSEIRISLPASTTENAALPQLLSEAGTVRPGNCGRSFRIDRP
ncbi:ribonuclease T2 family protein [Shewanella sp. YIC-542]|uniref:ribonuclease T2 family protein n=1 Tax=Shewanella mytili TaxID=3377111 RepID=UPI00398F7575